MYDSAASSYGATGARSIGRALASGDKKGRVLFGTFVGTMVCFILFVNQYSTSTDDEVWVWFGMRSDARCGRDFGTEHVAATVCPKGLCCSSHGWCGAGEEYCSVALGCQSGCSTVPSPPNPYAGEDEAGADGHPPHYDDDGGHYGRHTRYDSDDDYGYRGGNYPYRHSEDYHDYHHRYDEDPDEHDQGDMPDDHDHHGHGHEGYGGGEHDEHYGADEEHGGHGEPGEHGEHDAHH